MHAETRDQHSHVGSINRPRVEMDKLCAPIRSQLLSRVGNAQFRVGCAIMQGFREEMEDAHTISLDLKGHEKVALFGVYDGHSGCEVSEYLAKHLPQRIAMLPPELEDIMLQQAVLELDSEVCTSEIREAGSSCVFVMVHPGDEQPKDDCSGATSWKLTAVNVGDSRAMLIRADGSMVPLTTDHVPDNPDESKRIKDAGGFVEEYRVDGRLAMSRSIGDYEYKCNSSLGPLEQKVIARPDVRREVAYKGDWLLVFCDGVVERTPEKQVAKFVYEKLQRHGKDPANVMRELLLYSVARGSRDNHTAMLVCFGDGTGYTQPDVFIAGPFTAWKDNQNYVSAYYKNAESWGQTSESLAPLIAKADKAMPTDWCEMWSEPEPSRAFPMIIWIGLIGIGAIAVAAVLMASRRAASEDEL